MESSHNSNLIFEKNEYKFKLLYLIRKYLPKSEFLYLIMFALKYIGLILFSISLNVYDTKNSNTNIYNTNINNNNNDNNINNSEHIRNNDTIRPTHTNIDGSNMLTNILLMSDYVMNNSHKEGNKENNKGDNNNYYYSSNSVESSKNSVQSLFRKLLINGNSYKILIESYQIICFIGFIILIIYICLWIFAFFYMKKKYYNKVSITITDKMINQINQSDKFEKRFIRCLTYILFLIVFFHQYILEYYIFGFLGYILNYFGALNKSEDINNNNEENYNSYTKYINENLKNLTLSEIVTVITNLITIIILLFLFVIFMLINSAKTLYINNNYPLYSDLKNSIINIIFLNLNPIFGIINYFNDDTKLKIVLIFVIIIIILILIKIAFTYYYFSPLPFKLDCLLLFVEFFALFGCIINLITYLTKSEINSSKFSIIKAIFEIINALAFTFLLINKKNNINKKIFSSNLFKTNFKTLNPGGIYYYISSYLKYVENKENNYMTIFELIQNHVLNCTNKDCPGNILLPKSLSYSIFTDFQHYSNSENKIEQQTPNEDNNINETTKEENKKEIKEKDSTIKSNKKPILKSQKSKEIKLKSKKERRKNSLSSKINLNETIDENIISPDNSKINKKIMDEAEFIMIGEQEIINRINFLYRRKRYEYLEMYIFIHLQYIIKIKQNFRLALYFLGKYSLTEIKFGILSQFSLYEIKQYITKSIFDISNSNLIKDPYIKKYKDDNIKLEQLMNYISLFNIVRKILKISCESIIYFYSFRRELHNSLSLQKYKKAKIYQVFYSSDKIQSSINKLKYLLNNLNQEKKHSLESIELSYLICNFFKLLEGRVPQEILSNVKPILHFRDSLYDQLINEFHLFMMNNPLIIGLTQKDTFNIIYFTNIFLKKLGFSFSDLKYKDFHEKLFPGNQELIKEHSLILKQFLFFHSNTYRKFNTFVKSKEGYLISINFETKVFPTFLNDFLLIANIEFINDLEYENKNISNKKIKDKNNNNNNRIINTFSFMLNTDYDIFALTKNFYSEFNLNQKMFQELRINFCQFFCIDENKLTKQIIDSKKKLLKEKPQLNNQISLKESNKAYTIFQNIQMKNLFKIREEKILSTYNYPEMYIYEKIDKKKLIKKIPDIINIIDEIGLDYEWFKKLQNYKDRLTFNVEQNSLSINTFNSDQFFEAIFSLKKIGGIIYFVVNLNEVINKDFDLNEFYKRNHKKKSSININKNFKKMGTSAKQKFNRVSIKTIDNKSRKSVSMNSFTNFNQVLTKNKNNNNNKEAISGTFINGKKININLEEIKEQDKATDNNQKSQSKKLNKNSVYDNSEYLKSIKRKKRQLAEDDENTPLISKDRFNEILHKKEKMNKILILILYILIFFALCLVISKTIQAITAIGENLKVLELAINFEILKVDIYLESVLAIHYCIIEKKEPQSKAIINDIQKTKLTELMEHLNNIQEHISTVINNKNSLKIFEVIEERFNISYLDNSWNISYRQVDILEETRRLSYIISSATENSDELCNFDLIFVYSSYNLSEYKEGVIYVPNNKQKLFYYFIANILTNYKETFEKLSEECTNSLLIMYDKFQKIHLYLIFGVLFFLFSFIVIFCIKYCLDNSFYQLLFLYYYKIENEQKKFETQIYYLYKTNLEFNFDNIKYFEYIKQNCDSTDLYELNIRNGNSKINNDNNEKEIKINNNDKINKLEQNSMNGSLLNASMNGSSIEFLNKTNKLNLNNRIENNNYGGKLEEINENVLSQEETIDSLLKFIIQILPNSHQYSLIFILISIIAYIGICSFSIYETYNQMNKYEFAINLSMNILERVPRITELILYSTTSVLVNTTNMIQLSQSQSGYLKYFEIDSLYYSEEMLQNYFQNNLFGQLLKNNLKLKYNLENYLYNNKYNLFQNVQYWENQLNIIGEFCINLPFGVVTSTNSDFSSNYTSLYEFMQLLNTHALICKTQSPGMKDSGIKIEFNFVLQEITTKYIEFITYNKTTFEKLNEARLNFINTTDFEKIINDVKMYFTFYFNTIVYALKKDFEKQNNDLTNNQLLYSGLFFIVNIEVIISLIFIFSKVEKYKKLFSYFSTIPKDESINI